MSESQDWPYLYSPDHHARFREAFKTALDQHKPLTWALNEAVTAAFNGSVSQKQAYKCDSASVGYRCCE